MPRLVVEKGVDKGLSYRAVTGDTLLCGRDTEARLQLADSLVSRRHFVIECRPDGFFLIDQGSSNGTFLNGKKVRNAKLNIGDQVQAGETLFSFLDEAEPPDRTGLAGQMLGGYQILERVGRGGMGTVYRARQLSLDRFVALKVLADRFTTNRSFIERFHREARAAGNLIHPNIVHVHDVGSVGDTHYFSMEFMAGGSVGDRIAHVKRLTAGEAIGMMADVAAGLQYAEQQHVIHRDIKPDNLMIDEEGRVKIGDLGIAETLRGDSLEQTEGVFGSPHYMAPEQAAGKNIDHRVDIYSLGATFYRVLSGRTLFTGSSPAEIMRKQVSDTPATLKTIVPSLPPSLCQMIDKMLAKAPNGRYASSTELLEEIEKLQDSLHRGGERRRPKKDVPRKAWFTSFIIGSVALVLLGIVLGVIIASSGRPKPSEVGKPTEISRPQLPAKPQADPQALLEQTRKYAAANPHAYDEVISRCQEVIQQAPAGSSIAEEARRIIDETRRERAAAAEFDRLKKKIPTLLDAGSFAALLDLHNRTVLIPHKGTKVAESAAVSALRVQMAAEKDFKARLGKLAELRKQGKIPDAIRLCKLMEVDFAFGPYPAQVRSLMRELDQDEAIRQADDLRRRGQERERIRREPFELQNVIQEARKLVRDLRFADAARYCRDKTAGYKGPASEKAQAHCQRLQLLADLHAATVSAINGKSLDVNAAMLFGMAGKAESATDTEIIVSPEPNVKMPRKWSDIKLETLGKLYRRAAGDRPLRMGLPVYLVELHRYDDARAELESTGKTIPALADRCSDVALWLKACDGAERELAAADLLGQAMTAHIQNKNDEALDALTKLQKDYPNTNVCLGAVLPKGLGDTVVPVKPIEPKMK